MKSFIKQLYFLFVPKPRLPHDRAVILMYHSISDYDHFTTVSPENFKRQMDYLKGASYPVITLGELVRRYKNKEPLGGSVVITFDDGYRDNLTAAFPILYLHNFQATVFVETDCIGRFEEGIKYLTTEELKELNSSHLVSIQPHTKSHPNLPTLSIEESREEIIGSKKTIEELLGVTCAHFAYPSGAYNEETLTIVRDAGFSATVTVREGTINHESDLFRLPRNSIDCSTTFAQFKGKLSTAVDRWEKLKYD